MEELYNLLAILWVGTIGLLILWSIFRQKFSAEEAKYREMTRRASAARKRTEAQNESEGRAMPEWAEKLVEDLGLADYLDEEEMPDEIKRLLPLAKGFMQSGGLQKIFEAGGSQSQPGSGGDEGWH